MTSGMGGVSEVAQTRIDLLDRTLQYCARDYEFVSATYASIDTKAQAIFGVSGVFIAGTVALLTSLKDSPEGPVWPWVLVTITYGLLIAAIVASLLALRVRDVDAPMHSETVTEMTLDIIELHDDELTAKVHANWYREQLKEWMRVTKTVEEVNSVKARQLKAAQVMLIAAVICAGVATLGFGLG